ncbi:hypothetical protein DNTS_029758 [Danionella cerebrum]|uniref:Uncharacterized protein n=1 Tax=Danionella cerebrum TaxID=2873325 RepID=A0A553PUH6_9TELE|nr:hypothetical protein DNTS_029758 [Danionella translucida]
MPLLPQQLHPRNGSNCHRDDGGTDTVRKQRGVNSGGHKRNDDVLRHWPLESQRSMNLNNTMQSKANNTQHYVLPSEVPAEIAEGSDVHQTTTEIDTKETAEESQEKNLTERVTQSLFWRTRIRPLLCSTVDLVESFEPPTDFKEALCTSPLHSNLSQGSRGGISNGGFDWDSIPEPVKESREASERDSSTLSSAEQEAEWSIYMFLRRAWTSIKRPFLWCYRSSVQCFFTDQEPSHPVPGGLDIEQHPETPPDLPDTVDLAERYNSMHYTFLEV